MADDSKAPAAKAAAPAAPSFAPKVGTFALLTEQDPKKRDIPPTVSLFLVTAVGSASAPKKDAKGFTVTEQVEMKVGTGTKMVTRAVVETVLTYNGVTFSAEVQFPTPRRGVLVEALTPLEV